MSFRGSFVTQYIYCQECLKATKEVVMAWDKDARQLDPLPIIAGKVSGLYAGEELHQVQALARELAHKICHTVRIAVLPGYWEPPEPGEIIMVRPWTDRHDETEVKRQWIGDDYFVFEQRCENCGILLYATGTQMFKNPQGAPLSDELTERLFPPR